MKRMTATDWDRLWKEFHEEDPTLRLNIYQQKRIVALITDCFPNGAIVLDLGSGDGELAEKLQEAGHKVTCVDFSPVALEVAHKKGLKTIQHDLQAIDFSQWKRSSYDAVVVSHIIDHVEEPAQIVKLVSLVIKPEGFLAIAVHRADDLREDPDVERYPSRRPVYDNGLIALLRSSMEGQFRLEKHDGEQLTLCFWGQPPLPTLSLCLMAWNEEPFIEKCINSVPYDELIVGIDDATTDGTEEIVRRYVEEAGHDSQYYFFPHMVPNTPSYNFSARRNEGFEKASCDWILQIDAHEYLNPESTRMKEDLRWAGEREVFHIVMHRSAQQFHVPHVWKNTGEYCFVYAVHNILARKDGTTISTWRRALMPIAHCYHEWTSEKSKERAKQRDEGNIPGLLAEAEANPDSERPWFFIANAYLSNHKFDEAYEAYDKCLERAKKGQEELMYQCKLLQGKILSYQGKDREARRKLLGLLELHEERNEHFVYIGDTYATQKRFDKAERFYLMATHFVPPISCMFVEEDLYGWWLYERLFMVNSELKKWDRAYDFLVGCIDRMPRHIYEEKRDETVGRFQLLEQRINKPGGS